MLFLQSVQADCDGAESCILQFEEHFWRQVEPVCHHSPGETASRDAFCTLHNVLSHKGFTSAKDDENLARVSFRGDIVQHLEEVFLGHVGHRGSLSAIASTVAAMDVAANGALPEELSEGMFLLEAIVQESGSLERQSPSYAQLLAFHVANIRIK